MVTRVSRNVELCVATMERPHRYMWSAESTWMHRTGTGGTAVHDTMERLSECVRGLLIERFRAILNTLN